MLEYSLGQYFPIEQVYLHSTLLCSQKMCTLPPPCQRQLSTCAVGYVARRNVLPCAPSPVRPISPIPVSSSLPVSKTAQTRPLQPHSLTFALALNITPLCWNTCQHMVLLTSSLASNGPPPAMPGTAPAEVTDNPLHQADGHFSTLILP